MTSHPTLSASPETVHWGVYDAALKPAITIKPGETITIETVSGTPDDMPPAGSGFSVLPEHRAIHAALTRGLGPHILTGPVAVEGAMPGDALKVEILDVALRQNWGFNFHRPLAGALPDDFAALHRIHIAIDPAAKTARMPWGLTVPLAPFFGCMGTAPRPEWGPQTSIVPRAFGGNIDNKELVAGTTLYLPVFQAGALFSVGDGHGAQGHGEVNLTAIETALTGTFRLDLIRQAQLKRPYAETPDSLITMAFDPDLDQAMATALRDMIEQIVARTALNRDQAYALCSITADLKITQVVNGSRGVHCTLPRWALASS